MNATAYVDHAALLTKTMVARESVGPGDVDNAMRRIEVKHGISYGIQWALRYRKPKSIAVDVYQRIVWASEQQRQQFERRFREERAKASPQTWLGKALVRAADALAGEESGVGDE